MRVALPLIKGVELLAKSFRVSFTLPLDLKVLEVSACRVLGSPYPVGEAKAGASVIRVPQHPYITSIVH